MDPQRDYYEVLGVSPDATLEEIKKSYRRLVRKYHPDVHHDKKLAERAFVQISEAYRVLSDPDKRRSYDLERSARRREAASRARQSATGTGKGSSDSPPPRAGSAQPQGQTAAGPAVQKAVRDAEFAFIRGRLSEAESHARRALRADRTCARAWEVLGDVHQARNRQEQALQFYSYAVQFDPRNQSALGKLERLMARTGRPRPAAGKAGEIPRRGSPAGALLHMAGWCAVFLVLFVWVPAVPALEPALSPQGLESVLEGWNWAVAPPLAVAGLLMGLLLRSGGFFRHHADEMVFQTITRGAARPQAAPVGLLLVGVSLVLFWLALGVYLAMASVQDSMSRSLTRAFTVTLIFVLAAALLSQMHVAMLLFGGNVVFVSLLAGWWMVDFWPEAGEAR
ncbi:MAG: DnaJ domain-containing protein [Armatimonadota bacterium]